MNSLSTSLSNSFFHLNFPGILAIYGIITLSGNATLPALDIATAHPLAGVSGPGQGVSFIPVRNHRPAAAPIAAMDAEQNPPAVGLLESTVFVGGIFTNFGQSRLGLLQDAGGWAGPAIPAQGVRTALIRGKEIYLGGDFTSLAGQPRLGLARLDRSGNLDPTWKPEVTGSVHVLLESEGILYLGGSFSAVGGEPRRNLAAIDLKSGKLLDWKVDTDAPVWALAAGGNGELYVAGAFLSIADHPVERLARVGRVDGKVDEEFAIPCDADVRALVLKDDALFLGGFFQRIGALHRGGLAKIDLKRNILANDWLANADGPVLAISGANDRLYVGGSFTTIGGIQRSNLARVDLVNGLADAWSADTNEGVTALTEDPAGQLLVAGRFTTLAGRPSPGLARIDGEGKVATDWHPAMGGAATCLASDGALLVVAGGTSLDGPGRLGVASLQAPAQAGEPAITPWRADVGGNSPRITAIALTGDAVYLGGDFYTINGVPRSNLARVDRKTGVVDSLWQANANSLVRSLVISGPHLYVAGNFTSLGGRPQPYAGRLELATGKVTDWNPAVDGPVFSIAATSGQVWLTGAFSQAGGFPHLGLAVVDGEKAVAKPGTPDLQDTLGRPGLGNQVLALTDGRMVVGGEFALAGGVQRRNLAMITREGQVDPSWQSDVDGIVQCLTSDGQRLAVGGGFSQVKALDRKGLAVLSLAPGAAVVDGFPSMDGEVRALSLSGSGLWVGGGFPGHLRRLDWNQGGLLSCPPTDGAVLAIAAEPRTPHH